MVEESCDSQETGWAQQVHQAIREDGEENDWWLWEWGVVAAAAVVAVVVDDMWG